MDNLIGNITLLFEDNDGSLEIAIMMVCLPIVIIGAIGYYLALGISWGVKSS